MSELWLLFELLPGDQLFWVETGRDLLPVVAQISRIGLLWSIYVMPIDLISNSPAASQGGVQIRSTVS